MCPGISNKCEQQNNYQINFNENYVKTHQYDCSTLYELKKKTYKIFKNFDPAQYGSKNAFKRRVYWHDLFEIHDQTIMAWEHCSEDAPKILALRYAFFLAILVEKDRQGARYYMAVAGHPYKEEPSNYQGRDVYEAACFRIIDQVYTEMEKTYALLIEDDWNSNTMRKVRVELALEKAQEDPDLRRIWFEKSK